MIWFDLEWLGLVFSSSSFDAALHNTTLHSAIFHHEIQFITYFSFCSLLPLLKHIQPPSIFCHPQANCFHRRLLVAADAVSPSLSPGSPPNKCEEGYTENKSEIKQGSSPLARVLSGMIPDNGIIPDKGIGGIDRAWDMKEGDACHSESIGSSESKVTNDNPQAVDKEEGKDSDDALMPFSPNKRKGLNSESGSVLC
jgi:hypothetical protein